jgi:hypothetical protein
MMPGHHHLQEQESKESTATAAEARISDREARPLSPAMQLTKKASPETIGVPATACIGHVRHHALLSTQQQPHLALRRPLNDREQFLMFVKIVFRLLDENNALNTNDPIKRRVKAVIAECTLKNRNNDSDYVPLSSAVERRLEPILQHQIWNKAKLMMSHYLRNQQHQREQKDQT